MLPILAASVPFKPPPPLVVNVRRVKQLTPRMVRITFGGEQLTRFHFAGPASHLRVFLPDSETGEPILPDEGPEGNAFPRGRGFPPSRAYTPRCWNPEEPELDVEVALHGEGPGSLWASSAKEGDVAVISGRSGGAYFPDVSADWYIIAGDETALPAIGTLLDVMPSTMHAYVLAEVKDEKEELALESAAEISKLWLHRADGQTPGRGLADSMKAIELPRGDGRIWVSCEASIMREIRRHFIEVRGLDRSVLRTQGYWKAGASNHPDHDLGEDV